MRITFDLEFDRGEWPGPLRTDPLRTAVAGEPWDGPLHLLGRLEMAFGLGGLFPSSVERAAALSAVIRTRQGFWSRSAEKDPLGVAHALLHWIDWLRFHGWNGQVLPADPKTIRLRDLAALASSALPGIPDRLAAVSDALAKRRPDIESIASFEPIDRLLPLWRTVFTQLASHGIQVIAANPTSGDAEPPLSSSPSALPHSDLRNSLLPDFSPAGDGSLILFRPYGPLEAAEQVAAWLASSPDISDTVIINPDVVLDQALSRFGLPTTGAREPIADDPLLQILPLVLAMGWAPSDPQRALELLLISDGPIPAIIASRLRDALQKWPAVGSDAWNDALAEGLDFIADPASRKTVADRLEAIFRPDADLRSPMAADELQFDDQRTPLSKTRHPSAKPPISLQNPQLSDSVLHTPYPPSALLRRAAIIKDWANARRFAILTPSSSPSSPSSLDALSSRLAAVSAQCDLFSRLVDLSGLASFTEPQILRLNLEIAASLSPARRHPAQAGFVPLSAPGALAGPARRVVWWNFTLDSAPSPAAIPLTLAELSALESQGVVITPPTELASDLSRRWRRPLENADRLILVCPLFGDDGEERYPHPLWDEVQARLKKDASTAPLQKPALPLSSSLPMRTDPLLSLPAPKRSWTIPPNSLILPTQHSPSSLQTLIGCPFKWTLEKIAHLHPPEIAALTDTDSLIGNLTHKIIEEVLRSSPSSPKIAEVTAHALFKSIGPRLAAPLFLPGAPVQLAVARTATASAARDLVSHLHKARLRCLALESTISIALSDFEFRGRMDLVAGDPIVIIDLKWSGESYHRKHLEKGAAIQLASYAFLRKTGNTFPPVAFFILSSQRLVALPGGPFADAHTVDGPPLEETWLALQATMRDGLSAIRAGQVDALGIPPDDVTPPTEEDALLDGRIALSPPCRFCHFNFLCGLAWENAR